MNLHNFLKVAALASFIAGGAAGCSAPSYDEYYIKFIVGITPGDYVDITYNDSFHLSHNVFGVKQTETVEATIGPVYGGFRANIEATVNHGETTPRFIKIDASMNGGVFVTKASADNVTTLSWLIPISD